MTQRYSFLRTTLLILLCLGQCISIFGTPAFATRNLLSSVAPAPLFPSPEALADRAIDEEEFPVLTSRLQQLMLRGHSIEQDLAELQTEQLIQLRDYLLGKVAADPDLDDWEAHYRWQSLAALIYHIDADVYQAQLRKRAIQLAERRFAKAVRAFKDEQAGLPQNYRALALDAYRTLVISPPGVSDVCAAHLRDIENAFKKMKVDALQDLVREEHDVIFDQITSRRKKASHWLSEQVKGDKRFRYSRGVYSYVSTIQGENRKWLVEMDTIFPGAGYDGFLTFRSKHNGNIATTMRSDEFIQLLATGAIDSLLHDATEQYASESRNTGTLFQYDLPEEGRSAYLRFLPRAYGSAEFGFLLSSFVRSAALSHRYGDRISTSEIIFTNALADSLTNVLHRMNDQGIPSVIVEFASHGVEGGFQYGENPLSPETITDLIAANPDVKFLIRTPACYGGKLRDALLAKMDQDNALRSQVAFFAQSKPDNPNVLYFGSALDASVYDVFLLQNLLDAEIQSYGEAAERADRMTRRSYWTNAEVVYQGQLIR